MYQQLWGYKVEEKLYLGVRQEKRLNTTDIDYTRVSRTVVRMPPVVGQALLGGKKENIKQYRYTPWRRLEGRRYSSYSSTSAPSRPGRAFTPGERTSDTHCTGGWVCPSAGLDTVVRRKILCHRRGSNPDRLVVQPVDRHYTA
jgi:hypothetical protein